MRIHILAALAFVVPACAGDITSPGGGGGGAVCGNGTVETGEQCDDGNMVAGDGCSATCQTEQVVTPHVSLAVDKPTVTSDLDVESTITVTATSEMGYAGTVTLAADVKDSTNTAITDWTSTLDMTSLTLTAGGTATATLKLSALGDTGTLAGNITLTATGAATPGTATIAVTFNPVVDVFFKDDGTGTCQYPASRNYKVKAGRQLAVYNGTPGSTTKIMIVHTGGQISGLPHEGDTPGTAAGQAYLNTLPTAGQADQIYCHNDGGANQLLTGDQSVGPVIQTVN